MLKSTIWAAAEAGDMLRKEEAKRHLCTRGCTALVVDFSTCDDQQGGG